MDNNSTSKANSTVCKPICKQKLSNACKDKLTPK